MRYKVGKFIRWNMGRELTEGVLTSLHFPQEPPMFSKGWKDIVESVFQKSYFSPSVLDRLGSG